LSISYRRSSVRGVKKILHHSLNGDGIIEEYYVEHNGKLAAVLAEDVQITMYESHGKSDEEEADDDDEKDDEDHKEEDEEVVFGGSSPAHGVKPKLEGIPLLK